MKILGTGLSGLVGSRVTSLLSHHNFINFSLETGVDITKKDDISEKIKSHQDASWVFHLAAFTNVQQAELDKINGEQSAAWQVNVAATGHIVEACMQSGKKILYVDTDYAFDGTKSQYTEEDIPNPLSWYGVTKTEGAKMVLAYDKGLVIRISNPYRANPIGKKDFVHKMMDRLKNGQEIEAPTDQLFVPTFIDDIAAAIEKLTTENAKGIYHVVGSKSISPFDAARLIASIFAYSPHYIKPVQFEKFFKDRAPIPKNAVLTSSKLGQYGVFMRSFEDGLNEVAKQERKSYTQFL